MSTEQGADERRIRHALRTRGVGYAPQPDPSARPRDWLDDLMDNTEPRPADTPPPRPPAPPPKTTSEDTRDDTAEPRWDWQRLRHWPNLGIKTRLTCALIAIAIPIPHIGYSALTIWWYCVHQTRHNYGMGYGYALGGTALALTLSAVLSRGPRAGLLRITLLGIAAIGFLGAMSWTDPITLVTGATK